MSGEVLAAYHTRLLHDELGVHTKLKVNIGSVTDEFVVKAFYKDEETRDEILDWFGRHGYVTRVKNRNNTRWIEATFLEPGDD